MVNCEWCAGKHAGRCPLVAAIEYYPGGFGVVKRVEFHRPVPAAVVGTESPGVSTESLMKRLRKETFDALRPGKDPWLVE